MSSGGMSRGTHFGGGGLSGHKSANTGGGYYPQGNNAYHRNTNYGSLTNYLNFDHEKIQAINSRSAAITLGRTIGRIVRVLKF